MMISVMEERLLFISYRKVTISLSVSLKITLTVSIFLISLNITIRWLEQDTYLNALEEILQRSDRLGMAEADFLMA